MSVSLNNTPVRGIAAHTASSGNQTVKLMQELTDYRQLLAARDSTIQELSKYKAPVNKLRKVIESQMKEIIALNQSLHESRNELKSVQGENAVLKEKLISAHEQLDHVAESEREAKVEKVAVGTNTEVSVSFIRGVVNSEPRQSVTAAPTKTSPRDALSNSTSAAPTSSIMANSFQHFERPRDPRRDSAISVPDLDFFETPVHELAPSHQTSQPMQQVSSSSSNIPHNTSNASNTAQNKPHQYAAGISAPHLLRTSPSACAPPMVNVTHVPGPILRTSPAVAYPFQHQQQQFQQQINTGPQNEMQHQQSAPHLNFNAVQPIPPGELSAIGVSSPRKAVSRKFSGEASPIPVCKVTTDVPATNTAPIPNAPPSTPALNGVVVAQSPRITEGQYAAQSPDQLGAEVSQRIDDLAETVPILPSPEQAGVYPQVFHISI